MEESGGGIGYRTAEQLQQALDSIAGDAELRQRLAQRGRAAYLERWTANEHLRRYFLLIAELADARGEDELAAASRAAAAEERLAVA